MPKQTPQKDVSTAQQTRTLTSLAMLKVDIDEHNRTYIDYLTPFVMDILKSHNMDTVTDISVAEFLEVDFGLKVPVRGVQNIIRRMAKQGRYIYKNNDVYVTAKELPDSGISQKRKEAAIKIQHVYSALCTFVPSVQTDLVWNDTNAANAILCFLGRFTVDCLKSYVLNTALPCVPETDVRDIYIVSRFLQDAHKNDRSLFEDFIVLVKGQMYANALTCPDLESLEKKFNRVIFYLDTPLVLNLLGLHGKDLRQVSEELITLIRDLKGSLALFSHTLEEVKSVLGYVARHYDDPMSYTKILRETRNKTSLSDIMLLIEQVPERLSPLHVRLKPTPGYSSDFQIDETTFQDALQDEINYHGEHAIRNDINSVRSIYELRKSILPTRIEDAVAVFVTTNTAFAKTAFEFGKTHNSSREVSSVVTDYSLANVAWLKAPMKRPSLPEKETLAICYAALEPSVELFKKYVKMMDQLRTNKSISEHDHAILRLSPLAQKELMNLTLGDEKALNRAGLSEILDRVKETLVKDQKKIAEEDRIAMEGKLAQYKYSLELSNKDKVSIEQRLWRFAKCVSKILTIGLISLFSMLFLGGAFASSGLLPSDLLKSLLVKILICIFAFGPIGWSLYSYITRKTVYDLAQSFEHYITRRLYVSFTGKPMLTEKEK